MKPDPSDPRRSPPKIFLSAGERSGDLHGAGLARALLALQEDAELIGLGGQEMASAHVRLVADCDPLAVVGLTEVLPRLPRILRLLRELKVSLTREKPDLYVAIDAPDFNFRLMAHARRLGIPVVYFIVPQFWAWRRGRLRILSRLVERVLTIFPFEVPLLEGAGVSARFVGHPLAEELDPPTDRRRSREKLGWSGEDPLIAILPGSRVSECKRHLPPLLQTMRWVAERKPETQWGWSIAPGLDPPDEEAIRGLRVQFRKGPARDLLSAADAALVASGTATLESALLETPMVVFYRLAAVTSLLARLWVRVPHFAMVNLLAGEEIVPELFQSDARASRMGTLILSLIDDPSSAERQRMGFRRVRRILQSPGAYARAAREILEIAVSRDSKAMRHA